MAVPGVPDLLTVEEAARILRIGRTCAYEQVRRSIATEGREGIPVRLVGGQYRVPVVDLEARYGIRVTTIPPEQPRRRREGGSAPARSLDGGPKPTTRRRSNRGPAQGGLPFGR